jgi:hypothetical protein
MRRRRVAGVGLGHCGDGTFFAPTPEETDMPASKSPPTTIAAVAKQVYEELGA